MTIDQAIKKCKHMAERYTRLANQYEEYEGWFYEDKAKQCRKESAEYWQIMYWLKELKGEK
jgi:hypothetical protein